MKIFTFFFVFLWACVQSATDTCVEKQAQRDLETIISEFWSWRLEESPEYGTKYGLYTHEDRVEEYTQDAFDRRMVKARELLSKVNLLNNQVNCLASQEKISMYILESLLTNFIEGYAFRRHSAYTPFITFGGPTGDWSTLVSQMKRDTTDDFNNIITRYRQLPTQFFQFETIMREAIQYNTTYHETSLTVGINQMTNLLSAGAEDSFFMAPFDDMPSSIPAETQTTLKTMASEVVSTKVFPAISQLLDFVTNDYLPRARSDVGVWSLPNGTKFYRQCLKWHLSVDLTPQQVHQMGLDEVARITNEIQKIQMEDGISGSFQDYKKWLLNQSQFYYSSEDEMLQGITDLVDEIHNKLGAVLDHIPPGDLEVRKLENAQGPVGRYSEPPLDNSRPGIFWANVWNPETKQPMP